MLFISGNCVSADRRDPFKEPDLRWIPPGRQIEARMEPKRDIACLRPAELLRERRRHRLEATGQPNEEPP